MTDTPQPIGIAIVERDGRYLVGRRDTEEPLAGYDEFPGGKCQVSESPQACAERECLEETGLTVIAERLLLRRQFDYAHGSVDLHFWLCHVTDEVELAEEHRGFRWLDAETLGTCRFPEANARVIALLLGR